MILVVVISVILAVMTTYLLEKPLARRLRERSAKSVMIGGAVTLLALAALGWFIAEHAQWRRYPPQVASILTFQDYLGTSAQRAQFREGTCFTETLPIPKELQNRECQRLRSDSPNYLLLGDSHAAQYAEAMTERLTGAHLAQVSVASCPPFIDVQGQSCDAVRETIRDLIDNPRPVRLVLSARWREQDIPRLVATAAALRARRYDITVLGPGPEYSNDLPTLLASALLYARPSFVTGAQITDRRKLDRLMREAVPGVRYISVYDRLCPEARCRSMVAPGIPMLFDSNHLTPAAAELVLRQSPPNEL